MTAQPNVLHQLMAVIQNRKANPPKRSYTTFLLVGGVEKIGAKILEEAGELVEAARQHDQDADEKSRAHLVHEAADLIYHLLVLLAFDDIGLDDIESELARRFGICGLDEKESRENAGGS